MLQQGRVSTSPCFLFAFSVGAAACAKLQPLETQKTLAAQLLLSLFSVLEQAKIR